HAHVHRSRSLPAEADDTEGRHVCESPPANLLGLGCDLRARASGGVKECPACQHTHPRQKRPRGRRRSAKPWRTTSCAAFILRAHDSTKSDWPSVSTCPARRCAKRSASWLRRGWWGFGPPAARSDR